jgi:hypothetical protein
VRPIGTNDAYFAPERVACRQSAASGALENAIRKAATSMDTIQLYGPALAEVRRAFESADLYYVEMYETLPAKQSDLLQLEDLERRYFARLGRPPGLRFTRLVNAANSGFYSLLKASASAS